MDTEKTMEAIDVYLMYCAMKAHFNSDYDFIKYDGKTNINGKTEAFLSKLQKNTQTQKIILLRILQRTKKDMSQISQMRFSNLGN